MDASIRLVIERFPNVQEDARWLFARDEEFRELCEEYEVCNRAAERLDGSRLERSPCGANMPRSGSDWKASCCATCRRIRVRDESK